MSSSFLAITSGVGVASVGPSPSDGEGALVLFAIVIMAAILIGFAIESRG